MILSNETCESRDLLLIRWKSFGLHLGHFPVKLVCRIFNKRIILYGFHIIHFCIRLRGLNDTYITRWTNGQCYVWHWQLTLYWAHLFIIPCSRIQVRKILVICYRWCIFMYTLSQHRPHVVCPMLKHVCLVHLMHITNCKIN